MRGPLLDEVHQQLSPWLSQVKKTSYFDSTTSDIEPSYLSFNVIYDATNA